MINLFFCQKSEINSNPASWFHVTTKSNLANGIESQIGFHALCWMFKEKATPLAGRKPQKEMNVIYHGGKKSVLSELKSETSD